MVSEKPGEEMKPSPHSFPEAAGTSLLISCGFYFLLGHLECGSAIQTQAECSHTERRVAKSMTALPAPLAERDGQDAGG